MKKRKRKPRRHSSGQKSPKLSLRVMAKAMSHWRAAWFKEIVPARNQGRVKDKQARNCPTAKQRPLEKLGE